MISWGAVQENELLVYSDAKWPCCLLCVKLALSSPQYVAFFSWLLFVRSYVDFEIRGGEGGISFLILHF